MECHLQSSRRFFIDFLSIDIYPPLQQHSLQLTNKLDQILSNGELHNAGEDCREVLEVLSLILSGPRSVRIFIEAMTRRIS